MKKGYSHISIILDRSGSMFSIMTDIIGGFNKFIEEQKKEPGTASLTLVQFDDLDPYEKIYDFLELDKVDELTNKTFVPRGWTPLLDAIGKGIIDCGNKLSEMKEEERPENVIFVIITDGHENCSKEFTRDRIKLMIKEQEDIYSWKFMFLSSDLNAIEDAKSYEIKTNLYFENTSRGVMDMYRNASETVSCWRK